MKDYMLIMTGRHDAFGAFSPEEKERIMEKYNAFVKRLRSENRFKTGSALASGGYKLQAQKGAIVVDGPFAESKEALNGYFIFSAADDVEAVAIARDCPALTHGENVEIFALTTH